MERERESGVVYLVQWNGGVGLVGCGVGGLEKGWGLACGVADGERGPRR